MEGLAPRVVGHPRPQAPPCRAQRALSRPACGINHALVRPPLAAAWQGPIVTHHSPALPVQRHKSGWAPCICCGMRPHKDGATLRAARAALRHEVPSAAHGAQGAHRQPGGSRVQEKREGGGRGRTCRGDVRVCAGGGRGLLAQNLAAMARLIRCDPNQGLKKSCHGPSVRGQPVQQCALHRGCMQHQRGSPWAERGAAHGAAGIPHAARDKGPRTLAGGTEGRARAAWTSCGVVAGRGILACRVGRCGALACSRRTCS